MSDSELPGRDVEKNLFAFVHTSSGIISFNDLEPRPSKAKYQIHRRVSMAQLDEILPALTQGRSVRRDEWEPVVRMFVLKDALMCQSGNSAPWHHSLTWGELIASDWQLIHLQASVKQGDETSVLTAPANTERALLHRFRSRGPRLGSSFTRLITQWWNSE
jgi:hypothetical protein